LLAEYQGDFNTYYIVLLGSGLAINILYWVRTLSGFKKSPELNPNAKRMLTILLILTSITLLFWFTAFVSSLTNTINIDFMNRSYQISFIGLSLSAILIAYHALTKSGFWTPTIQQPKYTNSNLSEDQLNDWAERVKSHVLSHKTYMKPSLTLAELSKDIGVNKVMLSQIINQSFNMGFSDWINSFRINEFIIRAESEAYQHLTFIGIATDCGFNNKATFNKAFKKSKEVTPTVYFNRLKSSKGMVNE
jgi:AraC-like DNA-binding protein